MSGREAMLTAIRRGLKRGVLPADQQAMLRGRLEAHARHLIPARSQLPRPGQIALFVGNVEKEFGTVTRVPDLAGSAPGQRDHTDVGAQTGVLGQGAAGTKGLVIGMGEDTHDARPLPTGGH